MNFVEKSIYKLQKWKYMSSFKSRFCKKNQWFASSHPPQSSAVQWGGDIPTVSFQKQGLLYSIWPSSHHPWRIWRIHLLQVWKLLECFILGIWVCGSLPTNPIVGRLTSVESFPARRVHSPQVRFKIIFVLQFPLLLLFCPCLYIFQVPLLVRLYFPDPSSCTFIFSRSLFLYVDIFQVPLLVRWDRSFGRWEPSSRAFQQH